MTPKHFAALLSVAIVSAVSCLQENYGDQKAEISASKLTVTSSNTQPSDTLLITANRSWAADFKGADGGSDTIDWVSVIPYESINASGSAQTDTVILIFTDNTTGKARFCELDFHSEGGLFTIPVKQTAE